MKEIYPQLPETFGRSGVNALLGYEPKRAGLYLILAELDKKGTLVIAKADLPPDD